MKTCPYLKSCGGCQKLLYPYEKQLQQKQSDIEKLMAPYGKCAPILGMEEPYNYRNKAIATLANGYNMSAACGKESLRAAASSLSYTGSYWMSAVPLAACIACINKMKAIDLPKICLEKGTMRCDGLNAAAANNGFNLNVSGEPALFYLMLKDDDSLMLHQEWIAEVVKRGVYMTNHHNHFINAAL